MLSIGKLGTGQEAYYLEKVAEGAEDYYSGEGEAEGYWLGDAARDLGLEGKVEGEQLTAMLTGLNPADGQPLGLRAVGGRGPIPGFDLTFSAPKSVSLAWALGDQPAAVEVAEAHRASVAAALDYVRRAACWTRRGAEIEFVPGSGFLAAAYVHRSSRAGDPSSTPTSSSPTRPRGRTVAGRGSTTRRSMTTPRPPATSTGRTCAMS